MKNVNINYAITLSAQQFIVDTGLTFKTGVTMETTTLTNLTCKSVLCYDNG